MAVKRRKTKCQANSQNSSFVDLEENEREMENLMGELEVMSEKVVSQVVRER